MVIAVMGMCQALVMDLGYSGKKDPPTPLSRAGGVADLCIHNTLAHKAICLIFPVIAATTQG